MEMSIDDKDRTELEPDISRGTVLPHLLACMQGEILAFALEDPRNA
jgi:hypothetical protein